ncbi:hypothetical protein CCR94_17800 [Rhodoblastus sphagnicola]|uniref:Adenylate cyclase n=1 Tax=Rhodoblastus sphagnicola TaxID=333368 RepID=A0A2S6N1B4_9HYPH|nr:hypothetical protein [Rhodoblastus sphagnicola]MBB4199013.1 hypothetical protein [Rhodoblastus sphagnicola]PPQ28413.1 hypothetical protein CCR94_17800 [Rhodoblastus sphagnicola]
MDDKVVSGDEKIRALYRVLVAKEFSSSPRRRAFLRYIVEEEIAGRGHLIKEYSIAVDAYREDPEFDSAAKSNIRVQARRVREALANYYASAGASDPVRIVVPVGSYNPKFLLAAEEATAPQRPPSAEIEADAPQAPEPSAPPADTTEIDAAKTLAAHIPPEKQRSPPRRHRYAWAMLVVLCFAAVVSIMATDREIEASAVRLPETGLPRISVERTVFGGPNTGSSSRDLAFAEGLKTRLGIYGTLVITDQAASERAPDFRVKLTSLDPLGERDVIAVNVLNKDGVLIFSAKEGLSDVGENESLGSVAQIAATIAGLNGPVYQHVMNHNPSPSIVCMTRAAASLRHPDGESLAELENCLADAARQPDFEDLATDFLGRLLLREYMWGFQSISGEPILTRAERLAVHALTERSQPFIGLPLLAETYQFQGREAEALTLADTALSKYKDVPSILCRVGRIRMVSGQIADGVALIRRCLRSDPSPPNWVRFYLFLDAFTRDDAVAAAAYADSIHMDDQPRGVLAKIIVAHSRGDESAVAACDKRLHERFPEVARDLEGALTRSRFPAPIRRKLAKALKASGAVSASKLVIDE